MSAFNKLKFESYQKILIALFNNAPPFDIHSMFHFPLESEYLR